MNQPLYPKPVESKVSGVIQRSCPQTAAAGGCPREVAEPLVLMLAPMCPHVAEELWAMLGHQSSLAYEPFPAADATLLVADSIEIPVQINGKVRSRITVAADASEDDVRSAALADAKIAAAFEGRKPRKVIIVPGRMVNLIG